MAIYRGTGGSSTTTDETTVNAVNQKAAEAATSATNAASSASSAATSASTANTKASQASTSASSAATSATQASSYKDAAAASATNAAASESAAALSETAAETAETNAILYGSMANTAAGDAATAQAFAEAARDTAETYATQVENNKDAAAGSAAAALASETAAALSETAAAASETNAAASESAAAVSAIAADASANDAATSEANAAASEAGVAASAAAASLSETNAANSATAASTSATAAATSASDSSTSATASAASASSAATSATNAANSATASATSAANSLASANAAEVSANSAAALLDNFDDRYLGPKAAAPATDNDGDALVVGALYFDTTTGKMNVYTASGWLETGQAILALMDKFFFTATEGQTVFTGVDDESNTLSLVVGSELVTLNGVILEADTDYTAASGSITLVAGATAGDELNIISFNNFQLADAVSRTLGGQFENDISVVGDVTALAYYGDGSNLTGVDAFPDQTGQSGKFLTTNGTSASWGVVDTTQGDTAYSWGDHALEGYLTSIPDNYILNTGDSITGNLNFGDNDKAIFGAGSDLQIYHDGSNSYVQDAATGSLILKSNNIILQSTGGENMMQIAQNDFVKLYHDNSAKLATTSTGIDVTGTATMDGLTVENANLQVKLQESDGTYNPRLITYFDSAGTHLQHTWSSAADSLFLEYSGAEGAGTKALSIQNGDISFYEDTGTTAKFFWDASAERLGIGTSSPLSSLHIDNQSSNDGIRVTNNSTGEGYIVFGDTNDSNTGSIAYNHSADAMTFDVFNAERMRIDSSGNLLVGTTSTGYGNGLELSSGNYARFNRDSGTPLYVNRNTNDGEIISIRKDGATVGSIGVGGSGDLYIGDGDTALLIDGESDLVAPWNASTNLVRDNGIDLGYSAGRFKDLYLSGTANVNTVDLGNWTVTESGGVLYFATSGVNKMKLDASGNLTVTGEVTAYGTI